MGVHTWGNTILDHSNTTLDQLQSTVTPSVVCQPTVTLPLVCQPIVPPSLTSRGNYVYTKVATHLTVREYITSSHSKVLPRFYVAKWGPGVCVGVGVV